jgi:hypothetical protein
MPSLHPRHLAELVALSVLLTVLWRVELGWHGWHGLIWVGVTHWAVPIGAGLFLAWLLRTEMARVHGHRWGLLGLALPFALFTLWTQSYALRGALARFGNPLLLGIAAANTLGMAPVAFAIGRVTRHPLPWALLLPSTLLVAGHLLWAQLLFGVDLVHAVKTGLSIPFVVFGLGLPWTARAQEPSP